MPIVKQNSWIAGEINPNLTEAVNNQLYFDSALNIENFYISKTQILKRPPSTEEINFDATDGIYTDAATTKFAGISYEVVWAVSGADSIYTVYIFNESTKVLERQVTFTLVAFNTQYVDFVTFDNKIIYTYPNRAPQILEVDSTDPATFRPFTFVNQPSIDFGIVDYSTFTFEVSSATNENFLVQVLGTGVTALIDDTWIGGMFFCLGDETSEFLGQGKIITRTPSGANELNFELDTLHIPSNQIYIGIAVILQQPIFFDSTEFPTVVSFFDSRLYFGNTKSLPMLVAGSRVNIVNDFNIGKGLPAEAIVYILNDASSSELKHIVGHIGLFLHTDSNEHVVIPSIEDGITPTAFIAQRLSDWGSNDIRPVIYNNFILFVNRLGRKILKIDSSSSNSFTVDEITKGMDITADINSIGVIDDPLVDVKLMAFTYADNPRINFVTLQEKVYGLSKYDYLPVGDTSISKIIFGQINNKSIILGISSTGAQIKSSLFTDVTTGLTQVTAYTSGSPFTFPVDTWLFDSVTNTYFFAKGGVSTEIPANFNFSGNAMNLFVKSVPLTYHNEDTWDRKEISYVFISYFNSSRFFVNGVGVAFPTVEEIAVNEAPPKTSYDKITSAAVPDKFVHIEITGNEPYNVEIQAYGWNVKPTIID